MTSTERVSTSQLHKIAITLQNVSAEINEVEHFLSAEQKAKFAEALTEIVNQIDNTLNQQQ